MNLEFSLVLSVLKNKNLISVLSRVNSDDLRITENKQYFDFVKNYFERYSDIPSQKTMEDQFKTSFQFPEHLEKEQFYVDKIIDKNYRENLISVLRNAGNKIIEEKDIHEIIEGLNIGLKSFKNSKQDIFTGNAGRDTASRFRRYIDVKQKIALTHHWELNINPAKHSDLDIEAPLTGGRLYLIQARPGVGKTFLACIIAGRLGMKGLKSLIISKEMSTEEVLERIDAFSSNISYSRLKKGLLTPDEEAKYEKYLKEIEGKVNIEVAFPKNCTQETIKQLIETYNPNIVIVDYLQLLKDSSKDKEKRIQMANIIYDLKSYSQIYKIPIIVVSATNREGAKKDETPDLENIAESDSIGFAIDVLLSLYQKDDDDMKNIMRVACNKNRHGKKFTQSLVWDIDNSQIYEI